eukprot:1555909-Alexandrium_andersonii.AAC.1
MSDELPQLGDEASRSARGHLLLRRAAGRVRRGEELLRDNEDFLRVSEATLRATGAMLLQD